MKRIIILIILVAALVTGWQIYKTSAHPETTKTTVPTAVVTRGTLMVTLPANGALESAQEQPVRTDISGTLVQICPDNTQMKPGDVVFQLDTKDLEAQRDELARGVVDAEDALSNAKDDGEVSVTQAQGDATTTREALKLAQAKAKADIEKAAAEADFAKGEMDRSQTDLTRTQRLFALKYIAGTKLQDSERAFRQKKHDWELQVAQKEEIEKQSREQVKDKETAVQLADHSLETTKANVQEHVEDAQIKLLEAQRKLLDVEKKIAQCTVLSPAAGLAVIETNSDNWPERRPYRLGDNVQSGNAPVRVYDFKHMQVRCQVGEMDIARIHKDQKVYVSSPTLAGRRYNGKVAMVEELAQESNVWQGGTPGKKVFGLLITLADTDPAHLRPGMTVDLEIVLDTVREATMVPIRAVFQEGKKSYVYVTGNAGFTRVSVTTGTRNDLGIEVRGKLKVGDQVALDKPLSTQLANVGEVQ
jgi:HlyD family secretion protein